MSLADERRSRRFRDRPIDPLMLRVFLALVGTLLLVAVGLGFGRESQGLEWSSWLLVALLVSTGAGLIYAALFTADVNVEKWAITVGTNEAAALVIIIAFPIAWAIRKVFPSDAT